MRVQPELIDAVLFAFGWCAGWALLWHRRPLPPAQRRHRPPVAVVVPARNEAANISELVSALVAQARPRLDAASSPATPPAVLDQIVPGQTAPDQTGPDEIVVVDDDSDDDTAELARQAGARVVSAPPRSAGWLGKPHACAAGAASTSAPVLVFIDADVTPADDLLDRVAMAVAAAPQQVISLQPWHRTGERVEQLSLLSNTVALMGSGSFGVWPRRAAATVAFGPVLAVDRAAYERVGGHGAPTVRASLTEDIELARAVGSSQVFGADPSTSFRMYPGGWSDLFHGWSRTISAGAGATRWWTALLVAAWVWSLAGGWLTALVFYPFSAVQFYVLARRAGSVRPSTAVCYPVAVAVLVLLLLRALWLRISGRATPWKGRPVALRP